MALKPGQIKPVDIKIAKLKNLESLQKKIDQLSAVSNNLFYTKNLGTELAKEFDALRKKISVEVDTTKKELQQIQQQNNNNPAIAKFVKTLEKDCSKVLVDYRKSRLILLRGIYSKVPTAFHGRSWENRKPKDSSKEAQRVYDMVMKKMGFKALRSNSIFTTTSVGFANDYGDLYFIFPKNGFSFAWNKNIHDLVLSDVGDLYDVEEIENLAVDVEEWYQKKYKKYLNWYFSDPYEIISQFDKFVAKLKQIKFPKANQIKLENYIDKSFFKEMGPSQTNFVAALKSYNEVIISGEYYAIDANSDIAKQVLKMLKIKPKNFDPEEDNEDGYY